MKNIGFIGLGNMGKGMAINLSLNDNNVIGYDLNPNVFDDLSGKNISEGKNIEDVVKQSEIIITMLPDGPAVKEVWQQITNLAFENTIIIDCSTIDVNTSLEVQKNALNTNLLTLDAPVSGGVMGANDGTLTFMVGGERETYNKVKDLFEIMGNKNILCGSFGAGQSAKICNNMLLASTMIAVGESFKLAKNLNLDIEKLYDVLSTSSGSCWAINNYCPYKGIGPKSPSDNDFKGGFSSALMFKDLSLAVSAAKQSNTKINFGIQSHKKFENIVKKEKGHFDFSYVVNEC